MGKSNYLQEKKNYNIILDKRCRISIFLFLYKNICFGYSLEAPQCDTTKEYHNICFFFAVK